MSIVSCNHGRMSTSDPLHKGRRPAPQDQYDIPGDRNRPPAEPGTRPEIPASPVGGTSRRGKHSGEAIAGEVRHTCTSAAWAGMIIGSALGILLLIFILQNLSSQQIWLLFWQVNLPVGISLLIAAIAGALVTALIGGLRMFQLNRALTKASKADH